MATPQEYYEGPLSDHGNYQYTTLEQFLNDFMAGLDPDDYISNVPKYRVRLQAMRGLREFYYDSAREIRAIERTLSPLQSITVPPDFVGLVRVSYMDETGQLRPFAEDRSMSIADRYLQNQSYELLFDDDGNVLQGSQFLNTSNEHIPSDTAEVTLFQFSNAYMPNKDLSRSFPNGKYRISKAEGKIYFSSDSVGRDIVLEYISDGLYTAGDEGRPEAEIRVHKFLEAALYDYVYYELVKNRRNVPANEKNRARKEYYNSIRMARRRVTNLTLDEIKQVMKGDTKVIKG